jgi:hypothetical protein
MIGRITVVVLLVATGCRTAQPTASRGRLPAPNPNGCYVIVYDGAEYRGLGDVFNGPGRWTRLERLMGTNQSHWRNRIRSLHVGKLATLTVFVDPEFGGQSQRFSPSTDRPRLDAPFSGRIESLEISCASTVVGAASRNR